jgi:hypothetical protein
VLLEHHLPAVQQHEAGRERGEEAVDGEAKQEEVGKDADADAGDVLDDRDRRDVAARERHDLDQQRVAARMHDVPADDRVAIRSAEVAERVADVEERGPEREHDPHADDHRGDEDEREEPVLAQQPTGSSGGRSRRHESDRRTPGSWLFGNG